ncbi:MAG: O-antigen ligase family protein [Acidobacteria bacterium]|nr:O-antigen ligase family protein [Acidobacteriota bacterium]
MADTHTTLPDRLALVFLVVFAAAAPHSIAASQIAAGLAASFWLAGLAVRRRGPELGGLGLPIALFVGVTTLSSVFSLEPAVSLDKLRSTSLILIVLVVAGTLKNLRHVTLVVVVLLVSAAATAAHTVWGVVAGRGVEVVALAPHGPLALAGVRERDVIVMCGQHLTDSPKELSAALSVHIAPVPLKCLAYVTGANLYEFELPPGSLPSALEGAVLRTARTIRARGTFSHFTTYAELLMQLAALALGLWLACPKRWASRSGTSLIVLGLLLGVAMGATFTRASWAALLAAALAMLWLRVGWRARVATALFAVFFLLVMNQASIAWRGVGFYNPEDLSMQYRRLMWTDGLHIIAENPLLGVGMDTVLVRWRELGVRAYDSMGLHSHFHSTPIQFAVERGLLGLAAWVFLVFVYLRLLFRLIRPAGSLSMGPHGSPGTPAPRGAQPEAPQEHSAWVRGLALGIFGSAVGFLSSGFLHYNFGDSEIVMLFWLLMGIAAALARLTQCESAA